MAFKTGIFGGLGVGRLTYCWPLDFAFRPVFVLFLMHFTFSHVSLALHVLVWCTMNPRWMTHARGIMFYTHIFLVFGMENAKYCQRLEQSFNGQMDRHMNGQVNIQTDGWTNRHLKRTFVAVLTVLMQHKYVSHQREIISYWIFNHYCGIRMTADSGVNICILSAMCLTVLYRSPKVNMLHVKVWIRKNHHIGFFLITCRT